MSVDVLPFALVDAMLEAAMRAAHDAANAAVSASVEDYAFAVLELGEADERLGAWRALWWR